MAARTKRRPKMVRRLLDFLCWSICFFVLFSSAALNLVSSEYNVNDEEACLFLGVWVSTVLISVHCAFFRCSKVVCLLIIPWRHDIVKCSLATNLYSQTATGLKHSNRKQIIRKFLRGPNAHSTCLFRYFCISSDKALWWRHKRTPLIFFLFTRKYSNKYWDIQPPNPILTKTKNRNRTK